MVGTLATLIVLATVFGIVLGGRGHSFRPGLARTSMRRASGKNLGSLLAVVGLAGLILQVGDTSIGRIPGVAPILSGIIVILIVGVVVARSMTDVITAVIGVGLLIFTVGVTGAIELGILCLLMFWLLGAVRGWFA